MKYSTYVSIDIAPAAVFQALAIADRDTARKAFFAEVAELAGLMFSAESQAPDGVMKQLAQVITDAPGDWGIGAEETASQRYYFDWDLMSWVCSGGRALTRGGQPFTMTLQAGGVELTASYRVGQTHKSDPLA